MGKNKTSQQPKTGKDKEKTANKTANTDTKKVTKKEEVKEPIPANAEVIDASVEEVQTEEVKKEEVSHVPPAVSPKLEEFLKAVPQDGFYDGTSEAMLLNTMERHISRMKPNNPMYVKMETTLSHSLAWAATKLQVQFLKQKKELGLATTNDEAVVSDIIETFNSMGVALEAHVNPVDAKQTILEFKEINPETQKAAEEELAAESNEQKKEEKVIEIDPLKWMNDDEARAGLYQLSICTKDTYSNKFNKSLMNLRTYLVNTEPDPVKKNLLEKLSVGELTEKWITIMGTKSSVLFNSIASAALNSLKVDKNPIFAHCILRKNFPAYSDNEIADILKVFIDINFKRNISPKNPELTLDKSPAVLGILEPTIETFESYLTGNEPVDKKVRAKLYEQYKSDLPAMNDTTFKVKAVNKMIEIRNLYVDPTAAFTKVEGAFPA